MIMSDLYISAGVDGVQQSRVNGAFRDAHSKLARHAESVIGFGGLRAEAKRLAEGLQVGPPPTLPRNITRLSVFLSGP